MGKTYTSTMTVQSFKEHTCSCCGAVYAYNLVRTVKGTADFNKDGVTDLVVSSATANEIWLLQNGVVSSTVRSTAVPLISMFLTMPRLTRSRPISGSLTWPRTAMMLSLVS